MLTLELDLLPQPTQSEVAIVIDVLRMTTTAAVLFEQGLEELLVVADVDDARTCSTTTKAFLLGERYGVKLPGFHGGNSPLEYMSQDLSRQRALLCTSNGSKAVEAAAHTPHLLLGSINNAAAVARHALALSAHSITLICAGTNNQVSLDDTLGAACIIDEIVRLEPDAVLSDACHIALALLAATPDLEAGLHQARHGGILRDLGFTDDIAFAATRNRTQTVPVRVGLSPARFTLAP
jgi:2-phosphosulfolactate phosphatase